MTAERAFQLALHGGCSVPAGALAVCEGASVTITGLIAAPDGSRALRETLMGSRSDAAAMGTELANRLLAQGGRALLEALA